MNSLSKQDLFKGIRTPSKAVSKLRIEICKLTKPIYEYHSGPGTDIFQRDWDNLILLDACRFDYFERQVDFEGELEPVLSRGAHSWEFMKENFVNRELHDTVYVTANPHAEKLSENTFYTVKTLLDHWNQDIGTVLPKKVVSAAIEAHERWPNKRLLIHFMQPHRPYLGPTADQIRDRLDLQGWDKYYGLDINNSHMNGKNIWEAAEEGKVTISELRKAYAETLDIVLKSAADIIENVSGRSVISSDHGELLGERPFLGRRFGHPHDIYTKELRVVPWFTIGSRNRRNITAEKPIGFQHRLDDEIINNQLQALGYAPE